MISDNWVDFDNLSTSKSHFKMAFTAKHTIQTKKKSYNNSVNITDILVKCGVVAAETDLQLML